MRFLIAHVLGKRINAARRGALLAVSLLGLGIGVQPVWAATLVTGVEWLEQGPGLAIQLDNEGGPVTFYVREFSQGTHLRLSLPGADLGDGAVLRRFADRGQLKEALVSHGDSGLNGGVDVDVYLHEPGKLRVEAQSDGLAVHFVGAGTGGDTPAEVVAKPDEAEAEVLPTVPPEASPEVSSEVMGALPVVTSADVTARRDTIQRATNERKPKPIRRSGLSNLGVSEGDGALALKFKGPVPQIQSFTQDNPPTLVIDLPRTTNRLGKSALDINRAGFQRVQLEEDSQRLRLRVSLEAFGSFESEDIPNGRLFRPKVEQAAVLPPPVPLASVEPQQIKPAVPSPSPADIAGLDFRRLPNGGGRVIVTLNNPEINPDIDKEGADLVVRFPGAHIGAAGERRLDVVDFATPVETIDLLQLGGNAELRISPKGVYRYTGYQRDNEYLVDVTASPISGVEALTSEEQTFSGERLSLNFQQIPVRSALQVIADYTGLNIITSDSVSGDLSLRLNDVPWDQALDLILQAKNLDMRRKGNVIRIAPAEELASQERRAYEALSAALDNEPLVTELIRINYAKAEDIAVLLKSVKAIDTGIQQSAFGTVSLQEVKTDENSLLSSRGSVTVDKRTNTLLVQDTATRVRELRKLIAKLDIPVRQIQIETRIVEATDDFSRSLGARLGFARVTKAARFPGATSGDIGNVYGSGSIEANNEMRTNNNASYPDGLSVNLGADSLNGNPASRYAYQIVKIGANYLNLLDLELSALQAEGLGKIIANPKITTTDKHEARIEQGQERVFSSGSLLQGGTTTKKAVLSLIVTPQVTPDNQIILDVKITNDSFAAADTLNTKQIETQTLLKNGETVVIGGIYQQAQTDSVVKTPLLGDLPVVGNLFKKRTRRDNRTELLIFLTPRIVNPDPGGEIPLVHLN